MKQSEKMRKAGADARHYGAFIKECPHKGKRAFQWREGWRAADKEIKERKERRGSHQKRLSQNDIEVFEKCPTMFGPYRNENYPARKA